MAASSPLVRLRRLALPLALVALCAAAAHGQTLTSAFLTSSTSVTVTLSNSTGPSSDCRNAFSYFDLNNGTKASPFANCTANGTFTVLLTLASAGTYAAGDQLNIKVNQTTLNTTAGAPFVAAAVAVAVPPVVGAATLTASRTVVVKLPLSGNTVPDSFATNMTVCGGAVELRAAGASAAKVAPFEACSLAADVLTLTLKSAGTYAPGACGRPFGTSMQSEGLGFRLGVCKVMQSKGLGFRLGVCKVMQSNTDFLPVFSLLQVTQSMW
mgnify:CR=1 FL=1